ncbi:MAG: hypothetical protein Q4F27_05580 [Desulfovibrionaceae bacterium]|nr:hypothetical protein [Desulfovibrionaceae bacterium]
MTNFLCHAHTPDGLPSQGKARHTAHCRRQLLAARRAAFERVRQKRHAALRAAKARREFLRRVAALNAHPRPLPGSRQPFDPELLFVECGRCGTPVIWEPGRASRLLAAAGIDPLELDASCLLVTDSCPMCGSKKSYTVQIYRISASSQSKRPPWYGTA